MLGLFYKGDVVHWLFMHLKAQKIIKRLITHALRARMRLKPGVHFQYNMCLDDTESDLYWDWFQVWDQDYMLF